MQEKFLSQKNIIIGIAILIGLLGGGYYWYVTTSSSSGSAKVIKLDPNLFNAEVKNFYSVKNTIKFDKTDFLNKDFYKKLVNYSENIPPVTPPGRLNPFVPYAAP